MNPAPQGHRIAISASLLVSLACLLLLTADASRWFDLVPSFGLVLLLALSLAGLAVLAAVGLRRRRDSQAGRFPASRRSLILVTCLTGVFLLSANGLLRERELATLPVRGPELSRLEVERRAVGLQQDFRLLLDRMAAPLNAARTRLESFSGEPALGFNLIDALDRDFRFVRSGGGFSLYRSDGVALAWNGSSYPAAAGLFDSLSTGVITFRAVAEEHLTRLYALLPTPNHILSTEITIDSKLDPECRERLFPEIALHQQDVTVRLQDFRKPESGFASVLEREGDLYTGGKSGEGQVLFAGLRSPERNFLGYIRLREVTISEMRRRLEQTRRDTASIIAILAFSALCLAAFYPSTRRGEEHFRLPRLTARLVGGLLLIWGGRLALSWFAPHAHFTESRIFDSTLFSSTAFFHLLRSPGDLLLTAGACLTSVLLVLRACGRLRALASDTATGSRLCAGAGLLALVAVGLSMFLFLPLMAHGLVANSSVNLLVVEPLSPEPATLALQSAGLLILLSFVLLLEAAAILAGASGGRMAQTARALPRPGDGISRWTLRAFLPGLALSAVLLDILIVPQYERATEEFLENTLARQVIDQREARESTVRATIESLEQVPDLAEKIATGVDPSGTSMALDVWLRTPLKDSGYNASILIVGPDNKTLSRFARNIPPAFDDRAPEAADIPPDEPILEPVKFINVSKEIWHADHPVFQGNDLAGTVTLHMVEDLDNLPFLTEEKPYARALVPRPPLIATLPSPSTDLRYAAYDNHGTPIFPRSREAPQLPQDWTSLLLSAGRTEWLDQVEDDHPVRSLFFSDGTRLFTLGFMKATLLERVARTLRLIFLALILTVALLTPAILAHPKRLSPGWWQRMAGTLGRTHYRKLLVTYIGATLAPLLVLSVFMTSYITTEIDRKIEDRGRQAIQAAAALARTILETEEESKPDDDTLYWLSAVVGEDANLYREGVLVATSRPELFSSGLLSTRIDGDVYRRISLMGKRFAMDRATLRGNDYRTITTHLSVAGDRAGWLLSLPLDAQTTLAIIGAREVTDTVIIVFVCMLLLMSGVGYVLARRVSRPIRSLSAAAARIAGGDFDAVVRERPVDETGELIASFNQMAGALKQQREDLERRRDYIEKILLNATIGVISMDREGRLVTVNPAAGSILDRPGLAPGATTHEIFGRDTKLAPLAAALAHPPDKGSPDISLTLPGPQMERSVRARVVPFLEGQGIILLLEDVTETVRSNRLAAWAEMARRIAHEIKNPLTPIQLSAEHIHRVYHEGAPGFSEVLEECLRTIMNEVGSLRRISAEFSTYARIPTPRKEPTDLHALLAEIIRPYRSVMPPGITLSVELPAGLPEREIDRSLFSRALVNLIENALQAMPRGGTLTFRAGMEKDTVVIEVVDTGVGMDGSAMERLFTPYFSTKDTGTGLGMAIARKAIEEHGGDIEVISAPGMGTTMRVLLPGQPGMTGRSEPV